MSEPLPFRSLAHGLHEFFVAPLLRAEQEARDHLDSELGPDYKVVVILVYTAIALTVQYYFCLQGQGEYSQRLFRALGLHLLFPDVPKQFFGMLGWTVGNLLLYLVFPAFCISLIFREPLADYGWKLQGAFSDGWVYLVMLAIVGPLVWLMSRDGHFQATYPFYQPANGRLGGDFWLWQVLYALQFVGLEFFFRGLLIHGLKHRFGPYCIPVMTIPYCMIHYGKPMPEAFAAILAGLALGFMSLKTQSIVLGAAIHISVALSMDLASLWRRGFFAG